MPFPSKTHWTAILAIGLPLLISGCAQTGYQDERPAATAPAANVNPMMLAQKLERDGNHSNAAQMYQQAAVQDPNNIDAYIGMGDNFIAIGSLDQAALAYAQALEVNPNNSRALRGLANARIMRGEPQFAVAQLEKAIQVDPSDFKAMNTLGVTKDMLRKHSEAQALYRRVLQANPNNNSAKNNLALSLALTGNHAESAKLLEDIANSTKSTPLTKQNLALVYAAAGRTEEAMMIANNGAAAGTKQQIAALESAGSAEDKAILLRRAFGIEFKGTQFIAPNQQIAVVTGVQEPAPYTDSVVNIQTAPGTQAPTIINVKTNVPGAAPASSSKQASTGKVADEPWADDWNEELVDAADIANMPDSKPATTTESTADANLPLPAAPAAASTQTASVPQTEPVKTDAPEALPMASAGPVNDAVAADDANVPVQVAQANAGNATSPASPAIDSKDEPVTATAALAATPVQKTDTATNRETPAGTPMVKTEPSTTATSTPVTAASTPASTTATPEPSVQIAALPPAETEKPKTNDATDKSPTTAATDSKGSEPKKLVMENGTTVTEQSVNAAKIYTVQIASFRKETEAAASWKMLSESQKDLSALPHNVEKADLGKEKGIYYRLQAGSFVDQQEAKTLCTNLKKRSIDCMVVEVKQVSMNTTPASSPSATSVQ